MSATAQPQTRPVYYSGTTRPKAQNPDRHFVQVEVVMPHLEKYGKPIKNVLTYGLNLPSGKAPYVGQYLLCPPTRLTGGKWSKGRIVALGAGDYTGPVKYAKAFPEKKAK